MFSLKLYIKLFVIVLLTLFFFTSINADTQSTELKKINEQLNSIKKLYDTGVLDEESYKSAKNRLDNKKNKLIAKKNNKKKVSTEQSKTLEKQLDVLEKLFKDGTLSEEEFLKTKNFLIEQENTGQNINLEDLKSEERASYTLNVPKDPGRKNWEKSEIIYGNYKISAYRQGGVKVVRISDEKKLLTITDNYKVKYFNNGEDVISIKKTVYEVGNPEKLLSEIEDQINKNVKEITEILKNPFKKRKKELFDTESHKLELFIEDRRILHYVGRYVKSHKAFFYQVLTDKSEAFHFYIKIGGKAAIALNMDFFNAKIDRAVRKAKKKIALEYDVSEEEIERIIEEKIGEETNKAIEESMESAVNESIKEAIRQSIGQELSALLVNAVEQATGEAIDSAIESELADAIDQEIARAVAMGIDEAAVSAGWEAYFEVLAQGGTYEEANAAAYQACGSACDGY